MQAIETTTSKPNRKKPVPSPDKVWPKEGLANSTQACEFLQVSLNTLKKYRDKGLIPYEQFGLRAVRYPWPGLHSFNGSRLRLTTGT